MVLYQEVCCVCRSSLLQCTFWYIIFLAYFYQLLYCAFSKPHPHPQSPAPTHIIFRSTETVSWQADCRTCFVETVISELLWCSVIVVNKQKRRRKTLFSNQSPLSYHTLLHSPPVNVQLRSAELTWPGCWEWTVWWGLSRICYVLNNTNSIHFVIVHRVLFEPTQRQTTARVEHFSGKTVVSATTTEWAIKEGLYRWEIPENIPFVEFISPVFTRMPGGVTVIYRLYIGVQYIPCIYLHARWSYRKRFRSLLLCPLSRGHCELPLFILYRLGFVCPSLEQFPGPSPMLTWCWV